jgi:ATP-dependent DNA helicase RecQ
MVTEEKALGWLRTASGGAADRFHEGQWEAIHALVQNRSRVLLVQRTGWGKSMVYFLTTRLLRDQGAGPTLIISPLLALMRNQLDAARKLGLVAETINTSNRNEWNEIMQKVRENKVDLLLVSPERLSNDEFLQNCLLPISTRIAFFVVDEAHCISDWGHDFRPDYQRINRILQKLPKNVAVLATTATANDRVVEDVLAQLGPTTMLQRGPLARHSLRLQNILLPNRASRLAWLADTLPQLPRSGIVYTLTVRDANRVAAWLTQQGIPAAAYHSQVEGDAEEDDSADPRADLEAKLLNNEIKALVATSALGMGFDKPDLGFVIHFQSPQSVVHYYQQVGRAGRAIDTAFGVLLGGEEDDEINQYFIAHAFPPEEQIQAILAALENAENGFTVPELTHEVNIRKGQLEKVLKLLAAVDAAPIIRNGNRWIRTPNPYQLDRERISRLTQHRQAEWQQMQDYMNSKSCLMEFLEHALDDPNAQPCGRCATCLGRPVVPLGIRQSPVHAAIEFERRSEVIIKPRRMWQKDAFPKYGWGGKIPLEHQTQEGRALSLWGDMGWARLVREGKEAGRFHDELVVACAEMVRDRWQPNPFPTWVTCVPSIRSPGLVPDFAQRLATHLGLPFSSVVSKVAETQRQRLMMNTWQQAHNLDGAFAINLPRGNWGPVLLVDDVVDSRWSMTVIGALLRQSGVVAVYPLALSLASASSG